MSASDKDPYSLYNMSEEELADLLDYNPATDVCALLWGVMSGVFALELADLVMRKNKMEG